MSTSAGRTAPAPAADDHHAPDADPTSLCTAVIIDCGGADAEHRSGTECVGRAACRVAAPFGGYVNRLDPSLRTGPGRPRPEPHAVIRSRSYGGTARVGGDGAARDDFEVRTMVSL